MFGFLLGASSVVISVIAWLVIGGKADAIMATLQDLQADFSAIEAGVAALATEIVDLKAQVAAGGVVTQAQLDELHVRAQAVSASIDAAK